MVPITLPSHAVILTGTYPMWNGVHTFTSPALPASIPTLAEMLKRHGYATAAFVSAYALNSMWGLNRGFDLYEDDITAAPGYDPFLVVRSGDATTTRMLAWLDSNTARAAFVWLHLYDAHRPYHPPEPYRSRSAGRPYDGAIAFDDAQVGRVLEALHQHGLYDSSLVIVASDHGESLGEHGESEHGFFVYNATLRVPLIVKWPGAENRQRVVKSPVSTLDIGPTIAQAVGLPSSDNRSFQGRTLARWLAPAASSETLAEPVYGESYYARDSFGWHQLRTLVTPEYKYIEAPEAELYDLLRDPQEQTNRIAGNRAVAASLRAELEGLERRFENRAALDRESRLDAETVEKLRSLGYVAYEAGSKQDTPDAGRADPKEKTATLNDVLRAGDLRRAGKYPEAAQMLAHLKASEPKLYLVRFEAGETDLAWGKTQDAVGEFRAALGLNPTFAQGALSLGRAYLALNQDAEAAQALELAVSLRPRDSLARLALAKVYFRQGAWQKAQSELEAVIQERPRFGEAHALYGIVLTKEQGYAGGLREIEQGLALGYREAIAFNYLGICRSELGRPDEAIEAYEEALKLDPRYSAACLNLALLYHRQGQKGEAERYYRKVCELSHELCQQYSADFEAR
jgi:arylsulfatase A-like enzyme/Flp pilus assembly protein TadD